MVVMVNLTDVCFIFDHTQVPSNVQLRKDVYAALIKSSTVFINYLCASHLGLLLMASC